MTRFLFAIIQNTPENLKLKWQKIDDFTLLKSMCPISKKILMCENQRIWKNRKGIVYLENDALEDIYKLINEQYPKYLLFITFLCNGILESISQIDNKVTISEEEINNEFAIVNGCLYKVVPKNRQNIKVKY